jgi:RNA-directed DNA polymerase
MYKTTTVTDVAISTPTIPGMPKVADDMSLAYNLGLNNWSMWLFIKQSGAAAGTPESCYSKILLAKRGAAGKRGKKRLAYTSTSRIQAVQKKVAHTFLLKEEMLSHVSAYESGRSTVDVARACSGKGVVAQLDCKDFFPSIRLAWVRELFMDYGYSRYIAGLLASLLCVTDSIKTKSGGAITAKFVPQGGVASPLLSNRVANRRIDAPVLRYLEGSGWEYHRYSDNIYLTHEDVLPREKVDEMVRKVRELVHAGGWRTHKVRVDLRWRQQKVLGLVVNEKANLARKEYSALKSTIHNCLSRGFGHELARVSASRGRPVKTDAELLSHLRGKLSYVSQVLTEGRTRALRSKLKAAEERWLSRCPEPTGLREAPGVASLLGEIAGPPSQSSPGVTLC